MNTDILQPFVTVAVFAIKGTNLLMTRTEEGKIVLPEGELRVFESANDAARRVVLDMGVAVLGQDILFVSEVLAPPYDHKIVLAMMGQYIDGEITKDSAFWIDTRELGKYQDDMTDFTVDALMKFQIALRSRGMARRTS